MFVKTLFLFQNKYNYHIYIYKHLAIGKRCAQNLRNIVDRNNNIYYLNYHMIAITNTL